jgi:hypothetical protein
MKSVAGDEKREREMKSVSGERQGYHLSEASADAHRRHEPTPVTLVLVPLTLVLARSRSLQFPLLRPREQHSGYDQNGTETLERMRPLSEEEPGSADGE